MAVICIGVRIVATFHAHCIKAFEVDEYHSNRNDG